MHLFLETMARDWHGTHASIVILRASDWVVYAPMPPLGLRARSDFSVPFSLVLPAHEQRVILRSWCLTDGGRPNTDGSRWSTDALLTPRVLVVSIPRLPHCRHRGFHNGPSNPNCWPASPQHPVPLWHATAVVWPPMPSVALRALKLALVGANCREAYAGYPQQDTSLIALLSRAKCQLRCSAVHVVHYVHSV